MTPTPKNVTTQSQQALVPVCVHIDHRVVVAVGVEAEQVQRVVHRGRGDVGGAPAKHPQVSAVRILESEQGEDTSQKHSVGWGNRAICSRP